MTSRQHVSFGTGSASLLAGSERTHVNMETRPRIVKVGQAGLGCRASPKKSGDLGPPHQSTACSKMRQAGRPWMWSQSQEVWDHHTSQLHAATQCVVEEDHGLDVGHSLLRRSSPECLDSETPNKGAQCVVIKLRR